jgi:uncharacterized protein involved in exopolysaccharide biosynthesis
LDEAEEPMQDTKLGAGIIHSQGDITLREALASSEGVITLRDVLTPLFRHKRVMITSFLLIALAFVFFGLGASNSYEAHMEILVNRDRVDPIVTTETSSPVMIPATAVTEEEINSEAELLRSRDVLERVVLENGLEEKEKHSWHRFFVKQNDGEYLSRAVAHLGKALKIETPTKTNLISVTYASGNPQTAYGVLNSLATAYVEKHVAVHRPAGSYEFFTKEADKYRNALAESEAQLASFGNEQGVVAPDVERTDMALVVATAVGSLHQAEQAMAADQQRIQNDKVQMEKTPERSLTLQATNASDSLMQELEANLLAAQVKRTQLVAKFDPSYPLVREADQEIADTQAAIAKAESSKYVNETTDRDPTFELLREDASKAQTDLAGQRATVSALKESIQNMQQQMVSLDQKALKQQDLLRAAKTNEDNYLLYQSKGEQERASDALDKQRIANVAIAVPPAIPTLPKISLSLVVMVGLCLAVVGSAGAAYAVNFLDSSFRTPRDVMETLDIPVVAGVPRDVVFAKHTVAGHFT